MGAKDEIGAKDLQRASRWKSSREAIGLSQAELAQKISELTKPKYGRTVSQQAIGLIEKGQSRNPWHLEEAAKVLGKKPAWLQFGVDEIDDLGEQALRIAINLEKLDPNTREVFASAIESAVKKQENQTNQ